MDRRALGRRLTGLAPVRVDGRSKLYLLRDVVTHLFQRGEDGTLLDPQQERAKLDAARREHQELANAERRGDLLDRQEVLAEWQQLVSNARAKLLALPVKLAQGDTETLTLARAGVREALEELAGDGLPSKRAGDAEGDGGDLDAAAGPDGEPVGGPRAAPVARGKRRARKMED